MKSPEKIKEIIDTLSELQEDQSLPKNTGVKLQEVIDILNSDSESSMKVNKAFNILEGIADNTNLQSYIRTQIWNITSMLEKV
ncbi:MAG: UPF0147 family protein [Candidatus Woesearchaeota archaeon]|jgi:uncharacterized protein (UPF0147 family)|nr:UPF0147 family protein [Candidatus Woesearchaeota archaeon]MDP7610363.1 UPF0147 family protein [Candidatus Woesearchaeota archaeon]|tara:strand:+ start:769 stop:1017 length:249 start_codon:yes stop_codon:yes gene_type:complete